MVWNTDKQSFNVIFVGYLNNRELRKIDNSATFYAYMHMLKHNLTISIDMLQLQKDNINQKIANKSGNPLFIVYVLSFALTFLFRWHVIITFYQKNKK